MKHPAYSLLFLVAVMYTSCSSDSSPDDNTIPQVKNEWTLMEDAYFGSKVDAFQVCANNNNVYVGYWDGTLEKPCVRKFNSLSKKWEYYGGGPINVPGNVDPYEVRPTFMFSQDGDVSYVGFIRSLTELECMLYRTTGGAWEQLPSVPLNLLPGYADGRGNIHQSDGFTFTARNGKLYAAVHYDNNTWQSEETCLAVFIYDNGSWSLLPQRISYPLIPNSFSWKANFSYHMINVSKNGNIYLNYWLGEREPDKLSANVSVYKGSGWNRITTSDMYPINSTSVTYRFNLNVYEEGGKDYLTMAPCLASEFGYTRVFTHNGIQWKELSTPTPGETPLLYTATSTCPECIFVKYSDSRGCVVKNYKNGAWGYTGKPGFTTGGAGGVGGGYNQSFIYDSGYLYLALSRDYYKNGTTITPRGMCVYRYKLQ